MRHTALPRQDRAQNFPSNVATQQQGQSTGFCYGYGATGHRGKPCIFARHSRASMTPPGTMLVDGQPVDSGTPISLGPGPHQIDLSAAGHKSVSDSITITQTQRDFIRSYNLQPLPIRIQHQLTPPGGRLFVNGKRQDISKKIIDIPYRKRLDIEYAKPGFVSKTQSQTVSPGELIALSLALDPEFLTLPSPPILPLMSILTASC